MSCAVPGPSRLCWRCFGQASRLYINPIISDINTRIATANGLYETTDVDQVTGATTYYLHNQQNLADSDIQIMFSDVGILVTANGTAQTPTWYGLTTDGEMLANLLTVKDNQNNILFQVDARTKRVILADSGEITGDESFKVVRVDNSQDLYTEIFSDSVKIHDGYYALGAQDSNIYPGTFSFTQCDNSGSQPAQYTYTEYVFSLNRGKLLLQRTWIDTENNHEPKVKKILEVDGYGETIEVNEIPLTPSTPSFTAANGVTVSDQTWTKIGNMVVGDLTISGVAVSTTTVTLGQLNVHPGHSVIGNARTSSVVARCSIDSSGNIKINSGTSIASTATIYLTFSFVAS